MKQIATFCLVVLLLSTRFLAQTITIDTRIEYQTIDGFGGFGPKTVWWNPPPHYDQEYLDLILDDLGSTILRTQIYWDLEPTNDDLDPNHINWDGFNFTPDSDNGKQFDFIRDLGSRGLEKLIASVWSPPTWMKSDWDRNLAVFCDKQCGGHLDSTNREEFAEAMVAYILKLKKETDVDLYALSIQNEPLFANPFESCIYQGSGYAELLKVVGARFQKEGIRTKLFGAEHMGSFDWNSQYFSAILDDPIAEQYLDIYAVHGYTDGFSPDYGTAQGWTDIYERVHAANKPLWMTETSDSETSGWDLAFKMARALHLAMKHGKISAWVYWYYADAMLVENQPTPLYYALKGYYRYIRPGFVQIGSSSSDTDIIVTAFKRDGDLTIVAINNSSSEKTASLRVVGSSTPALFRAYRTSRTENFISLGAIEPNSVTLASLSITTMVAVGEHHKSVDTGGIEGEDGTNGIAEPDREDGELARKKP